MSKELDRALMRAVREALAQAPEEPFQYQVRASALPFCGRAFAFSQALKERGEAPDVSIGHGLQCVFQTGHGVHSVTQDWLGHARLLWGDWTCKGPALVPEGPVPAHLTHIVRVYREANVCGRKGPRGYMPKGPCTHCNTRAWSYVEVGLSDPETGLSAHTDGVMPKFEAILELKTTHRDKHQALTEPLVRHWVYQASMYASLVQEQEKLPMKRILLVYFDRTRFEPKLFVRPVMHDTLISTRAAFHTAKKQVRLRVLPTRICATPGMGKDLYCPYAGMCFSPSIAKSLDWKEAA